MENFKNVRIPNDGLLYKRMPTALQTGVREKAVNIVEKIPV
jgi:hypothetical protein